MFRLLVTGARVWDDYGTVFWYLERQLDLHPDLIVVHGDCPRGADRIAEEWCIVQGVPSEPYPAEWENHGRAAGFIRNKQMVDTNPDRAVAFVRGESRGTNNCLDYVKKAGILYDRFEQPE